MTDRDALLRAICESPDDDAPRLIYADWLDEHGDEEWAEFIRTQFALSVAPADPADHAELRCREETLWHEYGDCWTTILAGQVIVPEVEFARGFPVTAAVDGWTLARSMDRFFAGFPVRDLTILKAPAEIGPALGHPGFGRLESLTIRNGRIGDVGAKALAGSPYLSRMRRLELRHCGIRTDGAMALAESANLEGLQELCLEGNPIRAAGVNAIVRRFGPGARYSYGESQL